MRTILDGLYKLSGGLAALSLACIMLIVFGQVMLNIIDFVALSLFNKSYGFLIPSYSLFSGYALGFATFLALGMGLRNAVHIRVTLLESRLPQTGRRVSLTIVALVGVIMGALFTYSLGELAFQSYSWGDRASGLVRVPLWVPQSVLFTGSLVFFIAAIDTFIEVLRYGNSHALTTQTTPEEML